MVSLPLLKAQLLADCALRVLDPSIAPTLLRAWPANLEPMRHHLGVPPSALTASRAVRPPMVRRLSGGSLFLSCLHDYPSEGQDVCDPCASGSFANDTGFTSCLFCARGEFSEPLDQVRRAFRAVHGVQCWARVVQATGAINCTDCFPGTFNSFPGAACLQCPAGTFADVAGLSACLQCRVSSIFGAHSANCHG